MKFIHDILKTYSQEQKEQFVENLNSNTPHRIGKKKQRGDRMTRLIKGLELTDAQKDIVMELKRHKTDKKEARQRARAEQKERILAIVEGTERWREIKSQMKLEHKERLEAKHDMIDIWIDLIDSLDDNQRDKLAKRFQSRKGKPVQR